MVSELDPVLKVFIVDLQRPKEEFDPEKFDGNSKAINLFTIPTLTHKTPRSGLKYVVEADLMICFRSTLEHNIARIDLSNILKDLGRSGNLQSAGFITVVYSADLQTTLSRTIDGGSLSLALDPRVSSNYKQTILKAKLGEYFRI